MLFVMIGARRKQPRFTLRVENDLFRRIKSVPNKTMKHSYLNRLLVK